MVMRTMRANFHFLKYFIYAVIAAFVLGTGLVGADCARNQGSAAAMVNSSAVDIKLFNLALRQEMESARETYGAELPQAELKRIREKVLDALIDETLALDGAKELGIHLSTKEFTDAIVNDPTFRDEQRQFSQERYIRFLQMQAQRGVTVEETEANIRQSLLLNKVKTQLNASLLPSPSELDEKLAQLNRRVKADLLVWDYKKLEKGLDLTEEQIKTHYAENRKTWLKPEQVKARHILIKPGPDGNTATAKLQADALYEKAKAGEDFAKLAEASSQDEGSAKRGGDLGFFSRQDMVKPFADKAFALKKGQISEPVLSQFGWHIIKLEDRKEGFTPTFANSRTKARDGLLEKLARELVRKESTKAAKMLSDGLPLTATAKELKVSLLKTEWFGINDEKVIPGLEKDGRVAKTLLYLEKGKAQTDPMFLKDGVVLAQITDEKAGNLPTDPATLEEQKTQIKRRLINDQGAALYQDWIRTMRAKAKIVKRQEILD